MLQIHLILSRPQAWKVLDGSGASGYLETKKMLRGLRPSLKGLPLGLLWDFLSVKIDNYRNKMNIEPMSVYQY
jgi:hypothetical protein